MNAIWNSINIFQKHHWSFKFPNSWYLAHTHIHGFGVCSYLCFLCKCQSVIDIEENVLCASSIAVVCASSTAVHVLCVHLQQQQQPAGRCCCCFYLAVSWFWGSRQLSSVFEAPQSCDLEFARPLPGGKRVTWDLHWENRGRKMPLSWSWGWHKLLCVLGNLKDSHKSILRSQNWTSGGKNDRI